MPDDVSTIFEDLAPPPGGEAGLRRRLRREPRRRRRRLAALSFAGAAGLAGLLLAVLAPVLPSRRPPGIDLRLAHGDLGPGGPHEPVVVPPHLRDQMALLRVPTESDRVVFYYVAALPDAGTDAPEPDEEHGSASEDRDTESSLPHDE